MRQENSNDLPLGKPDKLTIHWSAGNYNSTYDHYHFNIKGDGSVVQTRSIFKLGSHTWKRNTGNIGISMCAMYSEKFPPTKKQIEATAKLVAELMGVFNIPIQNVKDHAYYAKLDGYSNLRWDTGKYTDTIINKALWYRVQLVNGKIENSLAGKLR